jgi:hypothetical protein
VAGAALVPGVLLYVLRRAVSDVAYKNRGLVAVRRVRINASPEHMKDHGAQNTGTATLGGGTGLKVDPHSGAGAATGTGTGAGAWCLVLGHD